MIRAFLYAAAAVVFPLVWGWAAAAAYGWWYARHGTIQPVRPERSEIDYYI